MVYRSDLETLIARRAAVTRELDTVRRKGRDLADLQQAHEQELAALDAAIAARRKRDLPMLDALQLATPCNVSWDSMDGDERVRFCDQCSKSVYNLFFFSRAEAEALLRTKGELCVRMFRRADGAVITGDCPAPPRKKRSRKLLVLGAAATAAAVAVAATGSAPSVRAAPLGELVLDREQFMGAELRTEGTLVPGTLVEMKRPREYGFTLASKGAELSVRYDGVLPDTFREIPGRDLPVAVEGVLREDASFEATSVFARVASGARYEPHQGHEPAGAHLRPGSE